MVTAGLGALCVVLLAILLLRRPARPGTADFNTLHTAGQAAKGLRGGLTATGAAKAIKHLRPLLGAAALALTDHAETLAEEGAGHSHPVDAYAHGHRALAAGRTVVLG